MIIDPPSYHDEQERLLKTFKCVVGKQGAIYLSGPITTGKKFLHWLVKQGNALEQESDLYKYELQRNVIRPNEEVIKDTAEIVRATSLKPVIEPASLVMPSWKQADYYYFWSAVIERYTKEMIAVEGWQYSLGCVLEFHIATINSIPVKTLNGDTITKEIGTKLILDAITEIENLGISNLSIERLSFELRKYINLGCK